MRRIDRYFKKTKLNDITLTKCNDFINYLAYEQKLSRQTMATTLACLKMVFKHAVIVEKILKNNPTEYVFLPKLYTNDRARIISLEDKKRLYLEKEEIAKFLSEARSARNAFPFATFFMLLIYTGMRAGEALALQWDNIDFSKKLIYIRSTVYYRTNNRFDVYSPKTKSSVRDVVISDTLINELKSYRQKFLTYKMRHRNIWNDHGYDFVFVSKTEPGNPIRYSTVSSCTRRLGNKIGFKNLHPHLFRHTHVSILAAERIPLSAIRERLGHADDKTTEQIYLHITKQFKSEIALKFDKAIQNI